VFLSQALLEDVDHAAQLRLGLLQAVGGLKQHGQVVEVDGDVGVIRADCLVVEHPSSRTVAVNYVALLQAMGRTEDEIKGELASLLQRP
jgi:hypothetical protein